MKTQSLELRFTLTLDSTSTAHLTELFMAAIQVMRESEQRVPPTPIEPLPDPPKPSGEPESTSSNEPLIDARQVASFLNVSTRTVWRILSSGQIPHPVRIGRAVRWNCDEIRSWARAGCPSQDEWRHTKS
ncbi:helix-turn-helix transcriptional regulator [Bythopirellula goksoeyrii]|uniref:Helix-turn-helix domain protein n=1 Tax=Bythopirellula goksoeyrii TaxID=1400387 RepID=A0A5B9QEI2_9BACT|nr:helix-turn-helix domain-containing protein [Bythopirellula goksoeyrii]QEG37364.1 Helix-turn-helix domain protein [Bythopirellula goksoeyrii]